MAKPAAKEKSNNGAVLGFEAKLFQAADKMRSGVSPADYKHIALGLIFLKYILVKRILKKYGYPPDLQDDAVRTVIEQAERWSAEWANSNA